MMKVLIGSLIFVQILLLGSCAEDKKAEVSTEEKKVLELESEINKMSTSGLRRESMDTLKLELINALLDLYNAGISDSLSAQSLDKIHLTYSSMHDYVHAAHFADSLIHTYPDYPNREIVIESQFNNYDMFILPRNKEKVKYYLELLLKEYPDMPEEKKVDLELRLKHVDLTMEEFIEMQMNTIVEN